MVYQQPKAWQRQDEFRLEILSRIDWKKCVLFTEATIPDGRWGENAAVISFDPQMNLS
jgi:hypothetical protein